MPSRYHLTEEEPWHTKGIRKMHVKNFPVYYLMSLGIELLQPLINGFRSADITDLITNVIGGIVGYVLYIVFRPITSWILEHLEKRELR